MDRAAELLAYIYKMAEGTTDTVLTDRISFPWSNTQKPEYATLFLLGLIETSAFSTQPPEFSMLSLTSKGIRQARLCNMMFAKTMGDSMTDEEYTELLKALAANHLKHPGQEWQLIFPNSRLSFSEELRSYLSKLSSTTRLLRVVQDRPEDVYLRKCLAKELEDSPVRRAAAIMDAVGILPALDDVPQLVFAHFRRAAIPKEDIDYLLAAGYTQTEIEVLLTLAIKTAPIVATELPSAILSNAATILDEKVKSLTQPPPEPQQVEKKKPKLLNGIGKLLLGAVTGVGNALLYTGTLASPNPAAIGSMALASGGLAVSLFFQGLGDLRGE